MVQGRITEADTPTIPMGVTPSGLISDPPPTSLIFTPDALPVATLPLYPGLGQAPNMLVCTSSGGNQFGNICLDSLCVCVCVRIVAKRVNGASCFFGVRVTAEDIHFVPGCGSADGKGDFPRSELLDL